MLRPRRYRGHRRQEAELDITAFMNLMIVLVPVLLLSMVFSHVRIVDLQLPPQAEAASDAPDQHVELVLRADSIDVNYPSGVLLRRVHLSAADPDFGMLSNVLQELKRQLRDQGIDKRDIRILSEPDTDYQRLVAVIDTARSYRTVVAASVVQAELFPDIVLGDAPPPLQQLSQVGVSAP